MRFMDLSNDALCCICSSLVSLSSTGGLVSKKDFCPSDLWTQWPGHCWSVLAPLMLVCRRLGTVVQDLVIPSTVTSLFVKLTDIPTQHLQDQLRVPLPVFAYHPIPVFLSVPGGVGWLSIPPSWHLIAHHVADFHSCLVAYPVVFLRFPTVLLSFCLPEFLACSAGTVEPAITD